MIDDTVALPVVKVSGGAQNHVEDTVVREVPLTIHYNKEEVATILCSPGQMKELTLGFLASEGFFSHLDDIHTLGHDCVNNLMRVEGKPCPDQRNAMNRRVMSACCGKSRASFNFENDVSLVRVQKSSMCITLDEAFYYVNYLEQHSTLFRETGGLHNGGIGRHGEVLYLAHDIGRHNVLDKLLGRSYLLNIDLSDHVLFYSGRVSSEILLKVAKMNIPILIARSAPTDLALTLAEDLGIAVIGFARDDRLNIYTCPGRIDLGAPRARNEAAVGLPPLQMMAG